MGSSRDLFDVYKFHAGGSVLMGNNAKLTSIGIGTVTIRMFDGIVWTLTDVMHVSGLQRNLISLSALDSKGCECTIAGRVVKGALVIMKGKKVKNLYRLMGDAFLLGVVNETSTDSERKHIVQVELDAMKSSKDGPTGSLTKSSPGNPRRPKQR